MKHDIWKRALEGEVCIVLGAGLPDPPEEAHRLIVVDCAAWDRPLGPLLDLRDQLEALVEQTRTPLIGGAGLAFVDETPESHIASLINRLQRQLDCPLVIAIASFGQADTATLQLLTALLTGPAKLLAAVVLQDESATLAEQAATLCVRIRERHGDGAVFEIEPPAAAVETPSPSKGIDAMSPEVLRVLRAAAAVGDTFEADLVAALLFQDALTMLELLQIAIDDGVALLDRGRGIFSLPDGLGEALRESTTPSLAEAWHAELAGMMNRVQADGDDVASALAPELEEPKPSLRESTGPTPPLDQLAKKWSGRDLASRGAEHAEAAGDNAAAASRYLKAAWESATIGGHERALELADRAFRLLPQVPATDQERKTRMRALLVHARVLRLAAGSALQTSLYDALIPALEANALAKPTDRPELRAAINTLTARIAYEIGDAEHFQLALDRLHEAQKILLDVAQPLDAARLLNDEAAVLVRLGQLSKAAELLARSRDVFLRHAETSPEARGELAQTNHLVARLPLHGEHRPGDEDALAFALERARAAEQTYAELGDERERARVHETLGRLARLDHRPEDASRWLQRAFRKQHELGDAIGLARTTGALAELLVDAGRHDDAVQVLNDSVALNLQLGSRQGVTYNAQGLDRFEAALGDAAPRFADIIGKLRARISLIQ